MGNLYVDIENIKKQIKGIISGKNDDMDPSDEVYDPNIAPLLISINEKMDTMIDLMKEFVSVRIVEQQDGVRSYTSKEEKRPYNIEDKDYIPDVKTGKVISNVKTEKRVEEGDLSESIDALNDLD